MFHWRVTKYNPKFRNELGFYKLDEWIMFSEVGEVFDGKELTLADYLKIEDSYIDAILCFMDCLKIDGLKVTCIWANKEIERSSYAPEILSVYDHIKNRHILSRSEIAAIARMTLRTDFGCRLKSEEMYVHFGWDYYMYIGSKSKCTKAIARIEKSGLFVEPFKSPYLRR